MTKAHPREVLASNLSVLAGAGLLCASIAITPMSLLS